MLNLQRTMKLFEKSQPARLCLNLAQGLHLFSEKDEITFEHLVKEIEHHKNGKPKMKSMLAFANVMHTAGILEIHGNSIRRLLDKNVIEDLSKKFQCDNTDLLSAKPTIRRALFEEGPDAMEFMKLGKGISIYERKCQKEIIPGIAAAIVEQCQKRMEHPKFTGKLIIYDIGCGDGAIMIEVAKKLKNATIYAYDPDSEAIKEANKEKPKDLTNLTFSTEPRKTNGDVHVVLCINVLHDVKQPNQFLQMISGTLHSIGIAMIVDPMVSIHKENNLGNRQVVEALALGFLGCVHSNDCIHAMGPGLGKEAILNYIESNKLRVTEDMLMVDKCLFYHCFKVEKNSSGVSPKYVLKTDTYLK